MKLWLVRHARPLLAPGLCYGVTDVDADADATAFAASVLAAQLPPDVAVACSPLRRCLQLAEALQALRPGLEFRVESRLSEMDFGSFEGERWDSIARAEYARWEADFAGYRFGGRESVGEFMARVGAALADARAGGDVLWITHAGVARAVRLLAAGVTAPLQAADWPREGLAFGELQCFPI